MTANQWLVWRPTRRQKGSLCSTFRVQAAADLACGISHVSNVLRKLQLSTRHELTRWATQHRLV
jgi:hypothetical protein